MEEHLIHPHILKMKPQLKVDGQIVAEGKEVPI